MLAMQYSVRLPKGSNIKEAIERVENRKERFCGLKDLVHKSYLFDEEEKIYAPIYLWNNQNAARAFLFDGLFDDVIASFGRPRVRTWHILEFDHGRFTEKPTFACYENDRIDPDQRLEEVLSEEQISHRNNLKNPNLFARMTALDADRWELARFSFWANDTATTQTSADCVQGYRILDMCEGEAMESAA